MSSSIFGKLAHQIQILLYDYILCKKKNECELIPKFTEFLNYIFLNMCSTGHLNEK